MSGTDRTTIVVITHNYGRFLKQAVESAVYQSRRPSVLVIDDASNDDTADVVATLRATLGARFVYRREARNRGLATIRNEAARLVASQWVIFLDADDWLSRDYVEKGEDWIDRHPGTDVLTTDMLIVRGRWRRVTWRARPPKHWLDLRGGNTVAQTSFIRRQLIPDLGGYDPSLHYEDWDFWIRALKAGCCFGRLRGRHVYRREHGCNKSKLCDDGEATRQVQAKHPA